MKIAVLGTGNGGQALAGHLAAQGHQVRLWGRNPLLVSQLHAAGSIILEGAIQEEGRLQRVTADLARAVVGAELIMVATTATAHKELAGRLAPLLSDGQIVVLNPGRTCGALEFRKALEEASCRARVKVAEAQTLVYACRTTEPGKVNIIGVKDKVLLAAFPHADTDAVLQTLRPLYPCFVKAQSTLHVGFENIGAVFHPCVVIFNEAAIERGDIFYFYRDMTRGLANLIEAVDRERLAVAGAYGISPIPAFDWVSYAYGGIPGSDLCERMHNNPAYSEILSPSTIRCRQITEDIPTGILPWSELGRAAGVATPMMDALITTCSTLLGADFRACGRSLGSLGLEGKSVAEIKKTVS